MTTRSMSLDHLARPALAAFVALFAILVLTGCGTSGGSTGAPATPAPSAATFDDPASLIGAIADVDGSEVTVRGFLIATQDEAQLCGIVLESYPPQCGGPTLTLTGAVPQDVLDGLDTTTEPDLTKAWWGWVSVTGTVDAGTSGTPAIIISSIELADAPGA
jgi:hypothetical protein